jgi:Fe-S cluster biogenesis protein NfuA
LFPYSCHRWYAGINKVFLLKITTVNKDQILEKIENALSSIRPHLIADGGNVEVVEITDDLRVKIKWLGACESCSMSLMTMKGGIEYTIKSAIPEIISVEAINGN